jgi:O-antigen/teichoic acid export membrane protein
MRTKVLLLKNVSSSWFGLATNIVVGLLLSPFILHHLGDSAFGIWILIFSLTGYYGIFDLGIRSSVVRYVAKFHATNDTERLNKVINTSLFLYTAIGALALLVTVVGCWSVDSWFRIPPEFSTTARWLFLMVGSAVALGFPMGVFNGILEGLQRFYILNLTNIFFTVLRAVLIVAALNHGYGLLTVAAITVLLPLLTSLVRAGLVLRILPLRFGPRQLDRSSLRDIVTYSSATFMIMIAYKLRFKTDELVIGAFLSSAAITYFAIADRLVDYASDTVGSLAQIVVPMSSHSEARGDAHNLRRIFVMGNRGCALVAFPLAASLIVLGKSIIEAWVGPRYVATSYPVLLVLLIPGVFKLSQGASPRVLFGMGKHRILGFVTLMEGITNLILSIVLVRRFGIFGDALGTALPLTCTTLFFFPRHLCRVLEVRLGAFLREAYLLPLSLCVPLVAVMLGIRHWFVPHGYSQLAFQLTVAGALYGAEVLWVMRTRQLWKVGDLVHRPRRTAAPIAPTTALEEKA